MNLNDLMPSIIIAVGIVLMIVSILYSLYAAQARQKAWAELAERTGLQMVSGGLLSRPRLEGSYRNRPMTLYTFTRRSGKHSHTYTVVAVQVNNAGAVSLAIFNQGLLSQVGKLLGMQDIEIGDEEMDRRFVFRGQPDQEVQRILASGGLRQKLLDTSNVNLRLEGPTLKHTQSGTERNIDRLQALFDLLAEVAEGVERDSGG